MSVSATDVSVVIAFRDLGCPYRAASFDWVRNRYASLGVEIVVERGPEGASFSRAGAINRGVERAAGAVIVQTDPDSIVPLDRLTQAVEAAASRDGLVVPHDRYLYLTPSATSDLLAGRDPFTFTPDDCEEYGPLGWGNTVVFSRSTWSASGALDERFGTWGGDDAAFAYATEAFCGPARRIPGDVVHLWHPRLPQSIPGHPGYAEQFAILAEYRDAAAEGPDAVRKHVSTR